MSWAQKIQRSSKGVRNFPSEPLTPGRVKGTSGAGDAQSICGDDDHHASLAISLSGENGGDIGQIEHPAML